MSESFSFSYSNPARIPFKRPALLMEKLPDHPLMVLNKVFSTHESANNLLHSLFLWKQAVIPTDSTGSNDNADLVALSEFYCELPSVINALHSIYCANGRISPDALQIIRHFCRRYKPHHFRRELWCFLNAVL